MENGKLYLIIFKQEENMSLVKLAYWFEKRVTKHRTYEAGFYHNEYYYYPYKNVIAYLEFPSFTSWEIQEPIEGKKYLVYRVGSNWCTEPHYTIRKYHKGSFRSDDIKYWMLLPEIKN